MCQAVWTQLGSKLMLWERLRALVYDDALASMRQVYATLWSGFKKSRPRVRVDSSSAFPLLGQLRAIAPEVLSSQGAMMPAGGEHAAFDTTAGHVASRTSLQKTGKGMVEPRAQLSTPLGA